MPKLVNMEQAVERARHTLVIITPEWLADDWNGFQSLLAGGEDPAGMQQKLIPIILKQAKIPSRIGFLQAVDLTDPAERQFELERLLLWLTNRKRG